MNTRKCVPSCLGSDVAGPSSLKLKNKKGDFNNHLLAIFIIQKSKFKLKHTISCLEGKQAQQGAYCNTATENEKN
jgi:hypothetical protein